MLGVCNNASSRAFVPCHDLRSASGFYLTADNEAPKQYNPRSFSPTPFLDDP